MIIMNRRGQTSMPKARFEPTDSASKRSRPTPQTVRRLGPAISLRTKQFYTSVSYSLSLSLLGPNIQQRFSNTLKIMPFPYDARKR
jgi:hypothetical protein